MRCSAPAKELKFRCRVGKTTLPVTKVSSEGLPDLLIYRSERGDYLVGDDVCTCKSFLIKVRNLEPCKHICAEKFAPEDRHFEVDVDDYINIILSIVHGGRSSTLSLLIASREGARDGKEEEKEENN